MRIGIRGHDLNVTGLDTEGLLRGLRGVKLDALQLVCYKSFGDIPYAPDAPDTETAAKIGDELAKNGVKVILAGAYFNPVHPDKEKVSLGIDVFKHYLKQAKMLGTMVIGSETGSYNGDKWTYNPLNRTKEARRTVAEIFRELCDVAAENGAFVGIEGAAGHVCHDVNALAEVIGEINRSNIRVIFDLFNFIDESNADKYIDILAEGLERFNGKIHCFHIKDWDISGGLPVQRPVGQGKADFTRILSMIKKYDPDAALILEGTTGADIIPAVNFLNNAWNAAN